jgi:hypothetical protein
MLKGVKKLSYPKAYEPQIGYKYQILCRNQEYGREWEHCDYAKDNEERRYLINEYKLSYGQGWEFQSILLPMKYWNNEEDKSTIK